MPSSSRARVLLLIPHLGGGGAEHIAEILAGFLDRNRYEVHLVAITPASESHPGHPNPERIHQLNTSRIRYSALKLLKLISQIQPDAILSSMAHLNLLVLLLRPLIPARTRILIRQNGELSATLAATLYPRLSQFLYGLAYRRADLVICQSESMKREIQRELQVDLGKLAVLPNPLNSNFIRKTVANTPASANNPGPRLVAIGRLVPDKGFDILLDAFAGLPCEFSNTTLLIVGAGPCESSLKQQSESLGIANRVSFPGYVSNPAALFRSASLFVLSSRTEGIPNALLEAAAAGLPIATTPASAGLAGLVANKEGIWLANETSAEALRSALQSALETIAPGQRYPHHWIENFEIASAIPTWEAAIDHVIESTSL